MKWIEIKVKTTEEAYDAIAEMLTCIGAGGVAIEDPNDIRREVAKPNTLDYADDEFLKNLGDDVIIKAYFPGTMSLKDLEQLIREKITFISNFLETGVGYTGYTEVDDEDWSTAWKKYYKPVKISDRIVIKPSWEEYMKNDDEIVIELDPGMAFGTGTHETTMMCAQLLENYVKENDTIIDVGCGTGILSIIAARLGAKHATAIDIDEIAVRVAKENCELNHVDSIVNIFQGVLDTSLKNRLKEEKVDVIVANIIASVIIDISPIIPYYLKAGGVFLTSGIIRERRDEVVDAYQKLGFTCEAKHEIGEWVAIAFRSK